MKILLSFLVSALLLGAGEKATYLLTSGKTVVAEILQVTDARVTMRVYVGGGSLERSFRLADFKPQSAFRILRAVSPADDPAAHLKLAEFAASNGLIAAAERELRSARRLSGDKALGPQVEEKIKRSAALGLERLFRAALKSGHLDSAQKFLSALLIRYPAAKSDAEKEALYQLMEGKRTEARDASRRAKKARLSARETKAREAALRVPRRHLASGRAANIKGLLDSRHFSSANERFKKAVSHFDAAIESAKSLERKHQGDKDLKRECRLLSAEAIVAMKDSLLNSGSLALVRGQISAAMQQVNRVLALEAKNRRALAMRARIEIAANQTGYGYY